MTMQSSTVQDASDTTPVQPIAEGIALRDVSAQGENDLMFLKGERVALIKRLSNNFCLGYCEGIYGRFQASDVAFSELANGQGDLLAHQDNKSRSVPALADRGQQHDVSAPSHTTPQRRVAPVQPHESRQQKQGLLDPTHAKSKASGQTHGRVQHRRQPSLPRRMKSDENLGSRPEPPVSARRKVLSSAPIVLPKSMAAAVALVPPIIPPRSSSRNSNKRSHASPHSAPQSLSPLPPPPPMSANRDSGALAIHQPTSRLSAGRPERHPSRPTSKRSSTSDSGYQQSPNLNQSSISIADYASEGTEDEEDDEVDDEYLDKLDADHACHDGKGSLPIPPEDQQQQQQRPTRGSTSMVDQLRAKTKNAFQRVGFSLAPNARLFSDTAGKDIDLKVTRISTYANASNGSSAISSPHPSTPPSTQHLAPTSPNGAVGGGGGGGGIQGSGRVRQKSSNGNESEQVAQKDNNSPRLMQRIRSWSVSNNQRPRLALRVSDAPEVPPLDPKHLANNQATTRSSDTSDVQVQEHQQHQENQPQGKEHQQHQEKQPQEQEQQQEQPPQGQESQEKQPQKQESQEKQPQEQQQQQHQEQQQEQAQEEQKEEEQEPQPQEQQPQESQPQEQQPQEPQPQEQQPQEPQPQEQPQEQQPQEQQPQEQQPQEQQPHEQQQPEQPPAQKPRRDPSWLSPPTGTAKGKALEEGRPYSLGQGIAGGRAASGARSGASGTSGSIAPTAASSSDTNDTPTSPDKTEHQIPKDHETGKSQEQPDLVVDDYGFIVDASDDHTDAASAATHGGCTSSIGSINGHSGAGGGHQEESSWFPTSMWPDKRDEARRATRLRNNERKWIQLMSFKHPSKVKKATRFKKLVREGIPPSLRGRVWLYLANADLYRQPGLFEELVRRGPIPIHEVIERDIHRCYPDHIHFRSGQGEGQRDLRNVLRAYAHYKPQVGYCQGMGRLVGMMLMQMLAEDAFWLLVATIEGYLQNYYTPNLLQLRIDANVIDLLLKEHDPVLREHLAKNDIVPVLYMTPWFLTLFTMSLPWASVLRVWDIFYFDGTRALFRVGLGILHLSRDHLLTNCPTSSELLAYILHIPMELLSPKPLLDATFRSRLHQSTLDRLTVIASQAVKEEEAAKKRSKE